MQVVTTHKNTDFDGLASTIAALILYPGAVSVLPRQVNPNVKAFLSIHKDILKTFVFEGILYSIFMIFCRIDNSGPLSINVRCRPWL